MNLKQALLLVFGAVVFCFGLVETIDPDFWWHLKTGELILESHFPHTDVFSYTAVGQPWVLHEWLSQVIFRLLVSCGGFPVVMIVMALLTVFTFSLVYFSCPGRPFLAFPLSLLAAGSSVFLWGARPQILTIAMFSLELWLVRGIRRKELPTNWLYAFPFLSVLWANLHGGHLVGMGLMGIILIGDFVEVFLFRSLRDDILSKSQMKLFAKMFFFSFLASMLNPEAMNTYAFFIQTFHASSFKTQFNIFEWLSPDFHAINYLGFLVMLGLSSGVFLMQKRRANLAEVVLYVGTMVAGLISRRHIPFFCIVTTPLIAQSLWDRFSSAKVHQFLQAETKKNRVRWIRYGVYSLLVGGVMVAAGIWSASKIAHNGDQIKKIFPVEAVRFIKEQKLENKRIFNEYGWGGYLIWKGIRVMIDGRVDVYGYDFCSQYGSVISLSGGVLGADAFISRMNIEYFLIPTKTVLSRILYAHSGFVEVYRDSLAVVFVRRDLSSMIKRHPFSRYSIYAEPPYK